MKLAAAGRVRRDDLPPDGEVRDGAGRRSAVEGSREARAVRHRRAERREGRGARAEDDARIGGGGARPRQARQRRRAVLHRAGRSAGARQSVHRVRPRVGRAWRSLQKISETPVDADGLATERVEIRHVTIRDTPPEPFVTEIAAGARRRIARCSTPAPGPITIEFFPDKAPEHVRQFLRLAAGRRLQRHGVPPRRAGLRDPDRRAAARAAPLTEKQQKLVHNLQPEFNDTKHVKGIVSMARGDDPDSATTSFFICTGDVRRRSTACTRRSVASWTAWRPSRPSRRRRGRRDADHADRAEDGQD